MHTIHLYAKNNNKKKCHCNNTCSGFTQSWRKAKVGDLSNGRIFNEYACKCCFSLFNWIISVHWDNNPIFT